MMRSLYSGVSGLRVHQTKMDVIGNNISNVNTVGFKSSSVTFTDILYQTTQNASGPNGETGTVGKNAMQIGLGSSVGAISSKMTSGSAQRTDNALDLMINGSSFFVVNNGTENFFTKAGSFTVDAAGTLCTSTGLAVMGYLPNKTGDDVDIDNVKQLDVMSAENKYTPPEATTKAHMTGNIDSADTQLQLKTVTGTTGTGGTGTTTTEGGKKVTIPIYDNKGHEYTVVLKLSTDTATSSNTNTFNMNIEDVIDATTKKSILKKDGDTTGYTASFGGDKVTIGFDGDKGNFRYVNTSGDKPEIDDSKPNPYTKLTLTISGDPNPFKPIEVDFSQLTNYATKGTSTIEGARGGIDKTGNGKPVGNMTGLSVDEAGKIYGSYDNGDKKLLGQIAVATFANPAGLEAVGNSLYSATLNSGEFNGIGKPISGLGETMTSGVLEMSNVDLANEFTELIVTQRGYQANSRIITTSDTLLEELINLKR